MLGDIAVADEIYIVCGYTDMRKSIDGLCAIIKDQLNYLKNKLFGSTSEIRHDQLPGQLNLFQTEAEDEPEPVPLEVEYVEVKAHKKVRKPLMMRSLQISRPKRLCRYAVRRAENMRCLRNRYGSHRS